MSNFIIGIFMIMGWLMIYTIVDRICKCKETCTMGNTYSKYLEIDQQMKSKVKKNKEV